MEIFQHYVGKQSLKILVIVHINSVGAMMKLCIYSSV